MSKGSRRRPSQVLDEVYRKNFEKIFGAKRLWWEIRDKKSKKGMQKSLDFYTPMC